MWRSEGHPLNVHALTYTTSHVISRERAHWLEHAQLNSTIVYRQIISLMIHFITIPVGQKFTYTKLTAWKIPEKDVIALEASDRLSDII